VPLPGLKWEQGRPLGPLRPTAVHPIQSLRDGLVFRFRGGIGPLRPIAAHPIQSLRDGLAFRFRGGIGDRGRFVYVNVDVNGDKKRKAKKDLSVSASQR